MKESQPIPAIAVSLATSLVAAPYLLIRNYYHKKVAPGLITFLCLEDFILLRQQAERKSPFSFFIIRRSAPTYTRPPLTKRWFYPETAKRGVGILKEREGEEAG